MKIYTKTGDKGETGLFGGQRVRKDSDRVIAIGEIDELSAHLGVCRVGIEGSIDDMLKQIQEELISLGGELAAPDVESSGSQAAVITADHVLRLEKWIDELDSDLESLSNFILPGGEGAHFHVARTVCRRAERSIVRLSESKEVGESVLAYVNRLSDLLFVMGRFVRERHLRF